MQVTDPTTQRLGRTLYHSGRLAIAPGGTVGCGAEADAEWRDVNYWGYDEPLVLIACYVLKAPPFARPPLL